MKTPGLLQFAADSTAVPDDLMISGSAGPKVGNCQKSLKNASVRSRSCCIDTVVHDRGIVAYHVRRRVYQCLPVVSKATSLARCCRGRVPEWERRNYIGSLGLLSLVELQRAVSDSSDTKSRTAPEYFTCTTST